VCPACLDRLEPADALIVPIGLDALTTLLRFDGAGRDLMIALKYRNRRGGVAMLASAMAATVDQGAVDVVTWAPTSPARRRERGFDQAQLLATGVARQLGLPVRRLLRRSSGAPQTGLDAAHRRVGPVFRAVRPAVGGVLLVDDVVTTGATLAAGAASLRASGASAVRAVTAAATPLKVDR
jgi:predicted amidophosphoribosyltransferase